jgi:hypothetical protein
MREETHTERSERKKSLERRKKWTSGEHCDRKGQLDGYGKVGHVVKQMNYRSVPLMLFSAVK